ncbi:MAG: hypothetical protein ACJ763_12755 [Bdellovibrionia bacterium]
MSKWIGRGPYRMTGFIRPKLGQLLKQSLDFIPALTGVGGLLLLSSFAWAEDGHRTVQVDGPKSGIPIKSGSSAVDSRVPTGPKGAAATPQMQDLSTNEQARLYQRANENLITQTIYIEENLQTVGDVSALLGPNANSTASPSDVQDAVNKIPTITSQYCDTSVLQEGGDNYTSALRCLEQFREMRISQLRDLKQGLVQNDDAQAKLRNELRSAKNKSGGPSNHGPIYSSNVKQRVFPEIPKYVDMQKDLASRGNVIPDKKFLRSEAEKIAARMLTPPKREDFVKVSEALIDPDNPNGGTFHQILTGKDGKPVLDEDSFRAAEKVYKSMLKAQSSDPNALKPMPERIKEIADRIMKAQDEQAKLFKQNNNSLDAVVGTPNSPKGPQACDALPVGPRQDYCRARDIVVRFFNGEDPSQQTAKNKNTVKNAVNRAPTAVKKSRGAGTEDYELKASKPSSNGKDENESLYMDPSDIDSVINQQYPTN